MSKHEGKCSFNRRRIDAIRTQLLDYTGEKNSLLNSIFSRFLEFTSYRNVNTFNDFEKKNSLSGNKIELIEKLSYS